MAFNLNMKGALNYEEEMENARINRRQRGEPVLYWGH
jgi:hypothetical protein